MKKPGDRLDQGSGRDEMLAYVRTQDPQGAERLEKLLKRKEALMTGNAYGERLTGRQFSLVFDPLLARAVDRSRILENLAPGARTVPALARELGIAEDAVFNHVKELLRRDLVEIAGYENRDALYRRK